MLGAAKKGAQSGKLRALVLPLGIGGISGW